MAIVIKWFPPSWLQLKIGKQILYVDPAYLRTNFTNYPKRIEFSKWPDPIDGLPEELEKAAVSISPKMVVPIHRFEANPVKFKEKLEGKSKIRVVPLNTGESCQI